MVGFPLPPNASFPCSSPVACYIHDLSHGGKDLERGERFERSRRPDDRQNPSEEPVVSARRRREQSEQAQATLLSLLEELEAIIEGGTHIPFTPKVLIDRDMYLDTVDAIKSTVPEAVIQAERIVRDREEI